MNTLIKWLILSDDGNKKIIIQSCIEGYSFFYAVPNKTTLKRLY
jgi:hypothetical protein